MAGTDKTTNEIALDAYIDKYLDGQMSEAERDAFETKCLEDKTFFRQVRERERLRQEVGLVIKEEGEEMFEPLESQSMLTADSEKRLKFTGKVSKFWSNLRLVWKLSVIAAGALVLLLLFILLRPDPFKPNPTLEAMLTLRSESNFVLISPQPNEGAQSPIAFRWATPNDRPVEWVLLDNKGNEVERIMTDQNAYIYSDILPKGLYYWKVRQGDEVRVGKFFVRKR